MPEEPIDFVRVIETVVRSGARVVLIGGAALILHGGSHVTYDVDFAYERSIENTGRLAEALKSFSPRPREFPPDLPFPFDARTIHNTTVLTLETSIGAIDLLGAPDGASDFEKLWREAEPMDVGSVEVRVASIDALIAMKTAANRPKDRRHLDELMGLKEFSDQTLPSTTHNPPPTT